MWVMLAMPVVWATWGIVWFLVAVVGFVWRTTSSSSDDALTSSAKTVLAIRISVTCLLALGIIYFILIGWTFMKYGAGMDKKWYGMVQGWGAGAVPPVGYGYAGGPVPVIPPFIPPMPMSPMSPTSMPGMPPLLDSRQLPLPPVIPPPWHRDDGSSGLFGPRESPPVPVIPPMIPPAYNGNLKGKSHGTSHAHAHAHAPPPITTIPLPLPHVSVSVSVDQDQDQDQFFSPPPPPPPQSQKSPSPSPTPLLECETLHALLRLRLFFELIKRLS